MGAAITSSAGGADIHTCTVPLPAPPHGPGVVIDGSATVLINNLPACRQGDTVLEAVGLPTSYGGSWQQLHEAMRLDKKSLGDRLRFVVLEDLARPAILEAPDPQLLTAAYAEVSSGV